jgi:hypothetical protein
MRPSPQPDPVTAPPAKPRPGGRQWLLFVHQLPSHPSNLRVRTWRRLQQLGALPLKQAVYVLPDTPSAREDFEWLRTEVTAMKGEATVFSAVHVDGWSDDELVEGFRRSGENVYAALARDVEAALKRMTSRRRPAGTRAPAVRRLLEIFRERLNAVDAIDFFGSAGRDRVVTQLDQLAGRVSKPGRPTKSTASDGSGPQSYTGRLWVTRPRPGVDRMSSAWLIKRFIDADARFGFAADSKAVSKDAVPFDMFGVELSHQGDGCTFETLCAVFNLREPALSRIAAIVHDLDLKDGRFGAPEATTVAALIEGLQLAHADDDLLLMQGMTLFDSLYRSFERAVRPAGPRPVARPRKRKRGAL